MPSWTTGSPLPARAAGGFRDDFFLKVTAAARSGEPDTVRRALSAQRAHLLRELRELRNLDGLRRTADDQVVGLLLAAAIRHVEADLAFVDDAEVTLLTGADAVVRRPARADPAPLPAQHTAAG